jgi:hypothetical protein
MANESSLINPPTGTTDDEGSAPAPAPLTPVTGWLLRGPGGTPVEVLFVGAKTLAWTFASSARDSQPDDMKAAGWTMTGVVLQEQSC